MNQLLDQLAFIDIFHKNHAIQGVRQIKMKINLF